jgi:uncharacterized membrane protein
MIPPNDWEIKNCLWLSLAFLLAMLGLIGVASLGFDIPILRQVIGFIFLTFIPGTLILRILKIHNVGIIESLLYSVGLSLAFLMLSGVFVNFTFPLFGISRPISVFPIVITLTLFTAILMAVAYLRDRRFSASREPILKGISSPSALFLILLLLFTVLGALVVNFYQNNILLLIFILVVAGIVGLVAFGKFIQPKLYPMAIAIIAMCLLYQTTLISPYLTGADIHWEYYFYRLAVENGYWNASIPNSVNSMLSIVMLAPVYSLMLNIDAVWLFKVVYPFLFSLVPLALFHVYSQQISGKKAFLAAFFFMAVPTFSLEMISLCRQQIAELFLALFILLMVDRKLRLSQRLTLAIIFALSIAVSHYGLGGICLFYFAVGWVLMLVIRSGFGKMLWGWLTKKFGGLSASLTSPRALPLKVIALVVVIYFVGSLAYYGVTASGISLRWITSIWQGQTATIATEFSESKLGEAGKTIGLLDFTQREPLIQTAVGLDFASASPQGKGFRILQYITQLFLVVGFIRLIFKPRNLRFTAEYIALTGVSALLLIACIFIPYFSSLLNATRFYHIALFLAAPLCILGGEAIWLGVSSLWRKIKHVGRGLRRAKTEDNQAFLGFITLAVLIPYFLFTSGFIFEVTKDKTHDVINEPYSIALSSYRLDLAGVFNPQDGAGAEWLAQKFGDGYIIYSDIHSLLLLSDWVKFRDRRGYIGYMNDAEKLPPDRYMFFRSWNIEEQKTTFSVGIGLRQSVSFSNLPWLVSMMNKSSKIYDNGGAQVLVEESN